jgi:hypothetical protein
MSVGKGEHQECPLLFRFVSAFEFRFELGDHIIYAMQPAISNDHYGMPVCSVCNVV